MTRDSGETPLGVHCSVARNPDQDPPPSPGLRKCHEATSARPALLAVARLGALEASMVPTTMTSAQDVHARFAISR